eukprot:463814_1
MIKLRMLRMCCGCCYGSLLYCPFMIILYILWFIQLPLTFIIHLFGSLFLIKPRSITLHSAAEWNCIGERCILRFAHRLMRMVRMVELLDRYLRKILIESDGGFDDNVAQDAVVTISYHVFWKQQDGLDHVVRERKRIDRITTALDEAIINTEDVYEESKARNRKTKKSNRCH